MNPQELVASLRERAAEYQRRAEATPGDAGDYWRGRRDQAGYDADQIEKAISMMLPIAPPLPLPLWTPSVPMYPITWCSSDEAQICANWTEVKL